MEVISSNQQPLALTYFYVLLAREKLPSVIRIFPLLSHGVWSGSIGYPEHHLSH